MPTIPAIGIVLVLSVDWFIGMARAAGNLVGNCVATVVVAAREDDLDKARAKAVLDGDESVEAISAVPETSLSRSPAMPRHLNEGSLARSR